MLVQTLQMLGLKYHEEEAPREEQRADGRGCARGARGGAPSGGASRGQRGENVVPAKANQRKPYPSGFGF